MKHHIQNSKTTNGFDTEKSCHNQIEDQHLDKNLTQVNRNSNKSIANNQQQIIDCLRIIRGENIGNFSFWRLIDIFGDPEIVVREAEDFFSKLNSKKTLRLASLRSVEDELKNVEKFGARIISTFDNCYPKYLRLIDDHPPILTFMGDDSLLEKKMISIVGARNCSFNGSCTAKKIALEFGDNSYTTVSGLAKGIDSAVHEASILSGTIAVVAGGINSLYPKENYKLFQQISKYGLIISEMPFNTPAKSNYFIRRNRIISGLSPALVVVEAGMRSGSLTTARFALEQNREIFACAGSPFDARCQGVNQLIKDGASIINDLSQLIIEVNGINDNFANAYHHQIIDNKLIDQDQIENNILGQENSRQINNLDHHQVSFITDHQLIYDHKKIDFVDHVSQNLELEFICQNSIENTKVEISDNFLEQKNNELNNAKNKNFDNIKLVDQNTENFNLQNEVCKPEINENKIVENLNLSNLDQINNDQSIIDNHSRDLINFSNENKLQQLSSKDNFCSKNQSNQINKIVDDILSKINHQPVSIDEIIYQLDISPKLVNIALVQLELSKRIIISQGKIFLEMIV